jgi:hypothetical protein
MSFKSQAVLRIVVSHDLGGAVEAEIHFFRFDDFRIDVRATQKHFRLRSLRAIGEPELEALKRHLNVDHAFLKLGIVALGEEEPLVLARRDGQPDIATWQGENCDRGTELFAAVDLL